MPEEKDAPDLFDLRILPAWATEAPNENRYADFSGEEPGREAPRGRQRFDDRDRERRERGPRPARGKPQRPRRGPRESRPEIEQRREQRPPETPHPPPPNVAVRFVPDARVLESVLGQIKSQPVAYSVFSLARMFLDKPERYDVHLKAESGELAQLGDNGPVSRDARFLENGAFVAQKDQFYRVEVTQSEPIKGNFNSIARCRLSGVVLGPTNYHGYQTQLRNLYEQRFSRRMSFPDYQRQVEIVTDPEVVARWKEEARAVTTYTTLREDPPITFRNAAETERHFRQTYLPALLHQRAELTLDGVVSRRLSDRSLGRWIENAWAQEFRSPGKMMHELTDAFRHAGLHIFRHRKGMLFVSPIRPRPLNQVTSSVSASIAAIVAAISECPGINRKQLLEKLHPDESEETREHTKRLLASDLHWLIGEGHVIEFNDGALDLPRAKAAPPPPAGTGNGAAESTVTPEESPTVASPPAADGDETVAEESRPQPIAERSAEAFKAGDELGSPPDEMPEQPHATL